jgi:DNA-binding NarL/FixJ family response regulator
VIDHTTGVSANSPTSPVRILVAESHDVVRLGVVSLLTDRQNLCVCGEARTGVEAVIGAQKLYPDIAIIDYDLPELNGLDTSRRIRELRPQTEILVISANFIEALFSEIASIGVPGYVLKVDPISFFTEAVEALAMHRTYFTPSIVERLTRREREVIGLIAGGQQGRQIALALGISKATAETYRNNLLRKLRVHSTSELVRYAIRNKFVKV